MANEYPVYNVYKGLQRPLIFKGFKGRFIYIGASCLIGSLVVCAIISTITSFMWGGLSLVIILFGGLGLTALAQKKGLHNKDKRQGVFIVSKTYIRETKR